MRTRVQAVADKAAVVALGLMPFAAFAVEPFEATFTDLGTKAGLIVTAAWVLWGLTKAPGVIMKIAGRFINKAS